MVVMMTRALDFYVATVQKKSAIGCKGGSTEAAVLSERVEDVTLCIDKFGCDGVKIWVVNIPEMGIVDFKGFCCAGKLVVL